MTFFRRLLYPVLASLMMLALHYLFGIRWGWAALVGFVGWPLLGTLITADDDMPGGWSNRDGSTRPPWLIASFWRQLSLGFAIARFVSAIDSGSRSQSRIIFVVVGVMVL